MDGVQRNVFLNPGLFLTLAGSETEQYGHAAAAREDSVGVVGLPVGEHRDGRQQVHGRQAQQADHGHRAGDGHHGGLDALDEADDGIHRSWVSF